MIPTIDRTFSRTNAYQSKDFSVLTLKGESRKGMNADVIVSYHSTTLDEPISLRVNRSEGAYILKKFQKILDAHRLSGKVIPFPQ